MKWIQTKQCDYILSKWTHKIFMDNMHVHSCVQVGTQTNSNIQVLVV